MRAKKWLTMLLALAMVLTLVIPAAAESVVGTGDLKDKQAEFTIAETGERTVKDGSVYVAFKVSVESKDGTTPIRAFSFCLEPTDVELATQTKADNANFYYQPLNADTLKKTTSNASGVYDRFEYTPASGTEGKNYFAAAGSDEGKGVTAKTDVLMIMAKVTGTNPGLSIITDAGDKQVVAGESLTGGGATQFTRVVNNCVLDYKAEASVSGVVYDIDGTTPFKGATVTLKEGVTTTTDDNGAFSFADVANGAYTIKVTATNAQSKKLNGSVEVAVAGKDVTGKTVTLREGIRGDLDGNGKINGKDLGLLTQYLAKWNVEINEYGADTDGNGKINGKDLGLLTQYLAKWNVTFKD